MWNLKKLPSNDYQEYELIRNSKSEPHYGKLIKISNRVRSQYNLYSSNCVPFTAHVIMPVVFTKPQKKALLVCYTSKTNALVLLKDSIRDHQNANTKGMCQSCGLDSDITFDHFLPKEIYPEFSVMSSNLIPYCSGCNTAKNSGIVDGNGDRIFINHYFDAIPTTQYLYVNLVYNNGIPSVIFQLINNTGIDPDLFEIIKRHYSKLKLLDRYKSRFTNIYTRTVNSINNSRVFRKNKKNIIKFLQDEVISIRQTNGVNFWESAVIESLVNSTNFLNQF